MLSSSMFLEFFLSLFFFFCCFFLFRKLGCSFGSERVWVCVEHEGG